MVRVQRSLRGAVALLVCLSAFGCGGPDGSPGDGGGVAGRGRQRGEGRGSPVNEGDGQQALGAPIVIPTFQRDQGRPLDEVLAELDSAIRRRCGGGELCVTLQVEPRDDGFTSCQFVRTEPAQETEVDRGTTVVIVAGTNPCEEPTSPDGGEQSPDVGEATEASVPEPEASP